MKASEGGMSSPSSTTDFGHPLMTSDHPNEDENVSNEEYRI